MVLALIQRDVRQDLPVVPLAGRGNGALAVGAGRCGGVKERAVGCPERGDVYQWSS
jgi:hypothetical protein